MLLRPRCLLWVDSVEKVCLSTRTENFSAIGALLRNGLGASRRMLPDQSSVPVIDLHGNQRQSEKMPSFEQIPESALLATFSTESVQGRRYWPRQPNVRSAAGFALGPNDRTGPTHAPQMRLLLDHLVRDREQRGWHLDAQRSRRLQVDGEHEFPLPLAIACGEKVGVSSASPQLRCGERQAALVCGFDGVAPYRLVGLVALWGKVKPSL
jgi:hypothetical protein